MHDRKVIICLVGTMLMSLALLVGCGDDDTTAPPADDTTRETIGATGGTLDRSGEASLAIPAGALGGDVDFTMDENGSPAPMTGDRIFATPVFDIGPDGTAFGAPATLTLHYDEGDLGSADESSIVLYGNDGGGWTPLTTTVDEAANTASADISHLSDYCATVPIGEAAEGVYAILEVLRTVNYLGIINYTDMITARFDTVVDPCNVHHALHPDSLFCNEYRLNWDPMLTAYLDDSLDPEFLVPGDDYTFEIFGNAEVPSLTETITMPLVAPYVTNIVHDQVLSLDGFTVEWAGTNDGNVFLGIIPQGSLEVVSFETPNDGEHTFTAQDLAVYGSGTYALNLIYQNMELIEATGYDPYSFISAGSLNVTLVNLTDDSGSIGPDGGILPLGADDGQLNIPAGALSSNVDFTADVNSSPTPAPDGWAFVTPVYTIEPSGTAFATDATLTFNYDEADLDGNDEDTIVIFTDIGGVWTQLTSDVIGFLDQVQAEIDHLSDFVAMVEVLQPAEGVYCVIDITRQPSEFATFESAVVRFDTVVDPEPVTPLNAAGVDFGLEPMVWDPDDFEYVYMVNPTEPLTLGETFTFTVGADADVPALTQNVTYIAHDPYITSPATGYPTPTVPYTGFNVEWAGGDGGTVRLSVTDVNEDVAYSIETENDGLFTIPSGALDSAPASYITVELECITTGLISATGYDPNSYWRTRSYSFVLCMLEE